MPKPAAVPTCAHCGRPRPWRPCDCAQAKANREANKQKERP